MQFWQLYAKLVKRKVRPMTVPTPSCNIDVSIFVDLEAELEQEGVHSKPRQRSITGQLLVVLDDYVHNMAHKNGDPLQ